MHAYQSILLWNIATVVIRFIELNHYALKVHRFFLGATKIVTYKIQRITTRCFLHAKALH